MVNFEFEDRILKKFEKSPDIPIKIAFEIAQGLYFLIFNPVNKTLFLGDYEEVKEIKGFEAKDKSLELHLVQPGTKIPHFIV